MRRFYASFKSNYQLPLFFFRVRKVQLALLGEMENKGLWDYLVLQGHLVHQEKMEIRYSFEYLFSSCACYAGCYLMGMSMFFRGRQEDQGRKAAKETKEKGYLSLFCHKQ